MLKYFFSIIFAIAFFSISTAQEIKDHSCRYYKSQMSKVVPTPEQLKMMEEMAFRSDTFDILHYAIHLDEVNYSASTIQSHCDIRFTPKMENLSAIHLDLLDLQVDSVLMADQHLSYVYDSLMLHIDFDEEMNPGDTSIITVYYGGHPTIDPSGFGGFDFSDGYSYNLGIGLASIPHNYGRGWFPCFDNFVERSTYDFFVNTNDSQFAYCVGTHISTDTLEDSKLLYHYSMQQPITTYQAAVAIANYAKSTSFHQGLEKEIPIELVSKAQDTTSFKNSFAFMTEAIEALEHWYGPYQWERVGYVITTRGAMEHPTCVAYPSSLGLNENPYNNMDIMSHELAHHWFGNLTTLTTAYDMWIKEGTSEYGYHLFTKDFLGDEEFYDLIASNQYDVIENAHRNDDGFRALSGMPFEYTYGTTTYQKGAAVIHNMHSYLGDSLFKVGVRAVLDKYAFSHCDAEDFEKTLSEVTGVDMSSFFNDWILAPGFSAFEIDTINILPVGNEYEVTLNIEQKLFHCPHYHNNVPMNITFFDADWNEHVRQVMLDGQYSEVRVNLDFEPVMQILNDKNFLNNGQLSYLQVIKEGDKYNFTRSKFEVTIDQPKDSLLLFVEHIWGAPDPILREDLDIQMSTNHYWLIDGVNPDNTLLSKARFYYEGNHEELLDYELTGETEEDIILLYRENASQDWIEFPDYIKSVFIPSDGKGFFMVDSLLFGQYAFGNGDYFEVNNEDLAEIKHNLSIEPNPARDNVNINYSSHLEYGKIEVFNALGQLVLSKKISSNKDMLDLSNINAGNYLIRLLNDKNEVLAAEKLIRL